MGIQCMPTGRAVYSCAHGHGMLRMGIYNMEHDLVKLWML